MSDVNNVRLGGGTLYINAVDVGYLSGEVTFEFKRIGFKCAPGGSGKTGLISIDDARLKAEMAEFNCDNLRLALGIGGSTAASTGDMSYNPASYDVATSSTSWEGLALGNEEVDQTTYPLYFVHEKEDGNNIVVILYAAVSKSQLTLPFGDRAITLYDIEFVGIPDEDRPNGDQIGMILEEI